MIHNIVFFSGSIDLRAGGPSGYIANLKKGLQINRNNSVGFITKDKENNKIKHIKMLAKLLTMWVPIRSYRKLLRDKIINSFKKPLFGNPNIDNLSYESFVSELDRYNFDSITCHFVRDALFIRQYLAVRNKNAKLILMSHSPEPPSQEFYSAAMSQNKDNAETILHKWRKIEKEAFENSADILLFPSKESVEPYSSALDYFETIVNNKQLLFLPTGCCQLSLDENAIDFREKYNIKTPYIISYIGRHNKIKGYDLLKEIASRILSKRDDVTFLIGGKVSSDIQPLNHPRWIELGFVNPPDVLSVSDCFILPNRQTYFDLVLLEVMSMGVPVYASATGGNKSVYNATKAITLYTEIDECVEKINNYLDANIDVKEQMKNKTLQAYKDNYTLEIFAKNYVELIESL